jgi:hypothetical protein
MKMEAIKRNAGRSLQDHSGQVDPNLSDKQSQDIIINETRDSRKQVSHYIRLAYLIFPLLEMKNLRCLYFI